MVGVSIGILVLLIACPVVIEVMFDVFCCAVYFVGVVGLAFIASRHIPSNITISHLYSGTRTQEKTSSPHPTSQPHCTTVYPTL